MNLSEIISDVADCVDRMRRDWCGQSVTLDDLGACTVDRQTIHVLACVLDRNISQVGSLKCPIDSRQPKSSTPSPSAATTLEIHYKTASDAWHLRCISLGSTETGPKPINHLEHAGPEAMIEVEEPR